MIDSTDKGVPMFSVLLLVNAASLHLAAQPTLPDFDAMNAVMAAPQPPSAGEVLSVQLKRFHGKPARYAFDRLGYPDKKLTVGGSIVYSWINETTNRDGSPLRCTVKVVTRKATITSTDFYGNNGACARFAQALDPSFTRDY